MKYRTMSLNLAGSAYCPDSGRLIRRALGCRSDALRAVRLVPEPNNPHDPNAIVVECQGKKIGYVAAKQAKGVAPLIYDGSFVGGRLVSAKTLEVRLRPENVQK